MYLYNLYRRTWLLNVFVARQLGAGQVGAFHLHIDIGAIESRTRTSIVSQMCELSIKSSHSAGNLKYSCIQTSVTSYSYLMTISSLSADSQSGINGCQPEAWVVNTAT